MHIALMADVHANLEALEACLAHARERDAQRFVFLGDHVGYGADPAAVVETIMGLVRRGGAAVLGNHDAAIFEPLRREMQPEARDAIEWTRKHLSREQTDFLVALPLQVEDGPRLYVHANTWAPRGWEYVRGPREAERALSATTHAHTFFGHVHEPALYHSAAGGRITAFRPVSGSRIPLGSRRRWIVLPGSVGQPRDGIPAASYALLEPRSNLLSFHRVPYDFEAAARKVRAAGLPANLSTRLEIGF